MLSSILAENTEIKRAKKAAAAFLAPTPPKKGTEELNSSVPIFS